MATGKSSSAKAKKTRKTPAKPVRKTRAAKAKSAPARKTAARSTKAAAKKKTTAKKTTKKTTKKAPPKSRSGILGVSPRYLKALAEYDKAMGAFQKRQYERAEAGFQKLIDHHPDQRDLVDRARVYVKTCQDQMTEAAEPQGFDDHYLHGVILANKGEYAEALTHFENALQINPNSDKVHYSLAASHARMGARDLALASLRRAVALDGSIRVQARQDSDFQEMKGDPEFDDLVAAEGAREPAA